MIIYKITNIINNKIYIGQDRHNNPHYMGSGVAIVNAVKKYGKEHFIKEIIEQCETHDILNEREKYWIAHYNSTDNDIGYNIALGGGNPIFPKEYYASGSTWYEKNIQAVYAPERQQKMREIYDKTDWKTKNAKLSQNPQWVEKNKAQREAMYRDPSWQHKLIERNKRMAQDPSWQHKNKEAARTRAQNPEWREKIRQSKAKTYDGFVAPDGTVYTNITNLKAFANIHTLNLTQLYNVYNGKCKHHKGWTKYIPSDNA